MSVIASRIMPLAATQVCSGERKKRKDGCAYLSLLLLGVTELLLHLFRAVQRVFLVHFHGQHLLLDGIHDCWSV